MVSAVVAVSVMQSYELASESSDRECICRLLRKNEIDMDGAHCEHVAIVRTRQGQMYDRVECSAGEETRAVLL